MAKSPEPFDARGAWLEWRKLSGQKNRTITEQREYEEHRDALQRHFGGTIPDTVPGPTPRPQTPTQGVFSGSVIAVANAHSILRALQLKSQSGKPLSDAENYQEVLARRTIQEAERHSEVSKSGTLVEPTEFDLSSADVLGDVAQESVESVADKMGAGEDSPLPTPLPPPASTTPSSNLPPPRPSGAPETPEAFANRMRDRVEKRAQKDREERKAERQARRGGRSPTVEDSKVDLPVPKTPPAEVQSSLSPAPVGPPGTVSVEESLPTAKTAQSLPTPNSPLPGPGSTIPRPPPTTPPPNPSGFVPPANKGKRNSLVDVNEIQRMPASKRSPSLVMEDNSPSIPIVSSVADPNDENLNLPRPLSSSEDFPNPNPPLPTPKFPRGQQWVPGQGNPPGTPTRQQGLPPTGADSYYPTIPPKGNYPWPPKPPGGTKPPSSGGPPPGGSSGPPSPGSPSGPPMPPGGGFGGVGGPPGPPPGGSPRGGGGGFGGVGMMMGDDGGVDLGMLMSPEMMLAKMAVKEVQKRVEAFHESIGEMGKAAKSEKIGDVGSHVAGYMEKSGQAASNPLVEYFGKLAKVLPESIEGLRKWGQQLHESNMKFSEFSASMAWTQARQEVRDMELSQTRGERRADSAEMLAQGKHRLEEQLAPWEDKLAIMKNELMASVDSGLATLIERVNDIAIWLKILKEDKGKGEGVGLGQSIANAAEKDFAKEYGRPPRFPNS